MKSIVYKEEARITYDNPIISTKLKILVKNGYIHNIDKVTILDNVHTITIDSPEVARLKEKADKIDELEQLVKKILEKNGGMTPMEQNHGGKNDKRTTNPSQ